MANDQPVRVLIVDDDCDVRRGLKRRLTASGYDVTTAACGSDALVQCEVDGPDIVILDVMMPDVNGFEVCENIRKRFQDREISVVFLTGASDPMVWSNLGPMVDFVRGDYYLTKPYDPAALVALLDDIRNELRSGCESSESTPAVAGTGT